MGEFQLTASLGRIRDLYLLHSITFVLVYGIVARLRNDSRPCKIEMEKIDVWFVVVWMEWFNQTLATA